MKDGENEVIKTDSASIKTGTANFYQELYATRGEIDKDDFTLCWKTKDPNKLNDGIKQEAQKAPTRKEIKKIIIHLANGKASGVDDIPAELWKELIKTSKEDASDTTPTLELIYLLVCAIWEGKFSMPEIWSIGELSIIFKAGDPTDLANYRPIALLPYSPLQYGSRPNLSSSSRLTTLAYDSDELPS